ncbi:hypothetical protein N7471_007701 [Penicillium samsonianum]|uniref:uncharacterized protein n=1 Tax=Penicillium samsonianum TaxID=1882272 RepID=UPI0025490B78|nr:uncharacterized protein N7471_007701 [Penicillium samsonianum]KAJ6132486.1 hypothetical protein N7471_007701 [Penicillium samsonianum]
MANQEQWIKNIGKTGPGGKGPVQYSPSRRNLASTEHSDDPRPDLVSQNPPRISQNLGNEIFSNPELLDLIAKKVQDEVDKKVPSNKPTQTQNEDVD